MKIALLNDTHCGVRNSSEIFIDFQERFSELIHGTKCTSQPS